MKPRIANRRLSLAKKTISRLESNIQAKMRGGVAEQEEESKITWKSNYFCFTLGCCHGNEPVEDVAA
jgi:hypothetical protein